MRKFSWIGTGILMMSTVVALAACDAGGEEDSVTDDTENSGEDAAIDGDGGQIGMSVLDLGNPFFVELTENVSELAEEQGYDVNINDPRDDVNEQMNAIDNFVAQGVDAIIVTATDQNAINEAILPAVDAGIPVIAHTTKLENADAWVGADEYSMGMALGTQAGEWIEEVHNGEGDVGIINFDQIEQVIQRKEGIIDGIHELSPAVEIVGDQQAGDPNAAYQVSEGFMQANPDLIGIFSFNDAGALGAQNAALSAGKDGETFAVGGIDAVPEAISAIREDDIFKFTVDQQPRVTAETIIDVLFNIMNDEDYEYENEIEVMPVNASNIEDY
ncbi:ribose ABC transport system, periplasmic ribose-binding protein RbsB [Geomicrobium sp. JCM 19037]|uniref:sugar ABC transporter substrate-binding protein n=1 Tax=Geomicrobium sp. JCM 19037 TaxID=1460634 RepID=UPI00045F16C4|nr:sugar ABC transporter substrate-binding protein [Geomicrobium sp. JCM 19037]GAK03492.1 ribose ABC transport system, periplasmic ribose-binding protein RbsB [Geomicrobium sp. JCM 19037]